MAQTGRVEAVFKGRQFDQVTQLPAPLQLTTVTEEAPIRKRVGILDPHAYRKTRGEMHPIERFSISGRPADTFPSSGQTAYGKDDEDVASEPFEGTTTGVSAPAFCASF